MSQRLVRVHRDTYVDSVLLMAATRAMTRHVGVEWGTAVMGTPANLEALAAQGFEDASLEGAGANDLVLGVLARSATEAQAALEAGEAALTSRVSMAREPGERERGPHDLPEALARLEGANVALVSVPGPYAALEAHRALSSGLHVLLFSDNVPIEQEVELKDRAAGLGLLVMGPGAGTAMLGHVGLGFANDVRPGPVGVVAAAGTGAQEVMTLLDRWGTGVSHVIGVGGRDVSDAVGGTMTRSAARALLEDEATRVILIVSKPPSPSVARSILAELGAKPTIVALLGLEEELTPPAGVRLEHTLQGAAEATLDVLGLQRPVPSPGFADAVADAAARLPAGRVAVRGLFSGGTLCYESMVVLSSRLGAIHSNVPLHDGLGMPGPPDAHVCIDMGEEEYTRGRPHPMIDPQARSEAIVEHGTNPATAVVLIDVVLGHASHPDPAGALAPACAKVTAASGGPAVVAYVLGTDTDPQGLAGQRAALEEAGCIVAPTAARAALAAAAICARDPAMVRGRA
jgi:FdrA protein